MNSLRDPDGRKRKKTRGTTGGIRRFSFRFDCPGYYFIYRRGKNLFTRCSALTSNIQRAKKWPATAAGSVKLDLKEKERREKGGGATAMTFYIMHGPRVWLKIWFMVAPWLCHPLRNRRNFIPALCGPQVLGRGPFFHVSSVYRIDRRRSINPHAFRDIDIFLP